MVLCKFFERAAIKPQKLVVPTPTEPGVYIIYDDDSLHASIRHFSNLVKQGAKGFVASPLLPSTLLARGLARFLGYVLFFDARARKQPSTKEIIIRTPHLETTLAEIRRFIIEHKDGKIVILFDAFQFFTEIENQGFYDVKQVASLMRDYIIAHHINCVVLVPVPQTEFFTEQKAILRSSIPATILE